MGGNPVCPHCGSTKKPYTTNRGYKCSEKACFKKFSVTTGTVFENTKIKLSLWFAAVYLATAHKKGISSLQLGRDLGITQKTAWFMLHRIRETMKEVSPQTLTGVVEVDETYVSGRETNKHLSKREKGATGGSGKTMAIGLIQRGANVQAYVVKTKSAKHVLPLMLKNVKPKSAS